MSDVSELIIIKVWLKRPYATRNWTVRARIFWYRCCCTTRKIRKFRRIWSAYTHCWAFRKKLKKEKKKVGLFVGVSRWRLDRYVTDRIWWYIKCASLDNIIWPESHQHNQGKLLIDNIMGGTAVTKRVLLSPGRRPGCWNVTALYN